MDREQMLARELERLDGLDQDVQPDAAPASEDSETEVELLAARVRAARLAGA